MIFDYAALERRISDLENAQTASLRIGRVTGSEGGKARVQFGDGQNMNSFSIPTLQNRVLKDQDIKMPDIGEPVAVLFAGNGCEQGVVLGAYYNGQENDPGKPQSIDYHRYEDGTELWYDREGHKLVARVKGEVEVEAEKTITAKAREEVLAESGKEIRLKAPEIVIEGNLTMSGTGGSGGVISMKGQFNLDGNMNVEGNITAWSVSEGH